MNTYFLYLSFNRSIFIEVVCDECIAKIDHVIQPALC